MLNITPDWQMIKTSAVAEEELEGFKWKGPGWYVDETGQTLLVVPMRDDVTWPPSEPEVSPWRQGWPNEQEFLFLSYSEPPFDSFNAVANAPVREDGRP